MERCNVNLKTKEWFMWLFGYTPTEIQESRRLDIDAILQDEKDKIAIIKVLRKAPYVDIELEAQEEALKRIRKELKEVYGVFP